MPTSKMKVAIYGKRFPEEANEAVLNLISTLFAYGVEVQANECFPSFYSINDPLIKKVKSYKKLRDLVVKPDFLITIGGDGTILDTITSVADSQIPIVGFNTGRLGFLANNSKNEARELVQALVESNYEIEERSLLTLKAKGDLFGESNFALNELTVHKKDSSSMVTIHTYVNDEYLNSYWADGLIIATPTGSTAYSLSCGGPILVPASRNFVINPIAPHNLSARPIIVPDDAIIKLKIEGREEEFLVNLDSRSATIGNDAELIISRANFCIKLVKFEGKNFLQTIRKKLLWGLDARN